MKKQFLKDPGPKKPVEAPEEESPETITAPAEGDDGDGDD